MERTAGLVTLRVTGWLWREAWSSECQGEEEVVVLASSGAKVVIWGGRGGTESKGRWVAGGVGWLTWDSGRDQGKRECGVRCQEEGIGGEFGVAHKKQTTRLRENPPAPPMLKEVGQLSISVQLLGLRNPVSTQVCKWRLTCTLAQMLHRYDLPLPASNGPQLTLVTVGHPIRATDLEDGRHWEW